MWIDWCCLSFKLCFSGPPCGSSSGTGIFRMNVETFETCSSFPCLPLRFETAACVCDGVWVSEERRGHCLVRRLTEGNHKVTAVHISGMIDAVGRCSPPPPQKPPTVCMAWSWGSCLLCGSGAVSHVSPHPRPS